MSTPISTAKVASAVESVQVQQKCPPTEDIRSTPIGSGTVTLGNPAPNLVGGPGRPFAAYIVRAPKTLLAIECVEGFGPNLETRHHGCWGCPDGPPFGSWLGFYLVPRRNHPARPANLLPLLQTCRMIYTEAVAVLYETNIFDFNHLDSLLYFRQSVLPRRLNQVRRVNLSWNIKEPASSADPPNDLTTWHSVCDGLASFQGLQELRVHLSSEYYLPPGQHKKAYWQPLLDPLRPIKSPARSVVHLPWSEDQCAEAAQETGCPFRLMPGEKE